MIEIFYDLAVEMCPNGERPLVNNGRILLCDTGIPCLSDTICMRSATSYRFVCCRNGPSIPTPAPLSPLSKM